MKATNVNQRARSPTCTMLLRAARTSHQFVTATREAATEASKDYAVTAGTCVPSLAESQLISAQKD